MRLSKQPHGKLLALYARIMRELKRRGVVRSENNPAADYAELLVVEAFRLKRAPKSTKGYDAVDRRGRRYEVKGRRPTAENPSRMSGAIRDLHERHFDYLVGVVFNEDFTVHRACRIPFDVVEDLAVYRKHVRGWVINLRETTWDLKRVEDVTPKVKAKEMEFTDEDGTDLRQGQHPRPGRADGA